MTLERFRKKWIGKSVGTWSTSSTPQCVDLVRQWMHEGWGFSKTKVYNAIPRGNAEDFYKNANTKILKKVPYKPGAKPLEGDIVVLEHGVYGHVMVAKDDCTKILMRTLDQNWSRPGKITDEAHRYSECIGFLRPR